MTRWPLVLLAPLLGLAMAYTAIRYAWALATNPQRAWRIALMIDETANVGLNGQVNETITLRAARARSRGHRWGCVLCWLLAKLDPQHCDDELKKAAANRPMA